MSLSRRDAWLQRLARYRASSLTVKEFCRRERVSVPCFYQWKKRLAETSCRPTFVPVSLPASSPAPVVIKLPGGAEVRIDPGAQPATFQNVLVAVIAETSKDLER